VVSVALVESWDEELDDLFARVAGRFSRVEPRKRAFAYVRGLMAPLERRNGWTLAEQAGDGSPDGMQALLCSPCWDPDLVRDDVREYVVERIGDPDGVLIADETGFAKKGRRSAGVQRQYSGTLGRTDNCQIGVFLAYVTVKGQARMMLERALAAGAPFAWFTADEAYGQNPGLRDWLEEQDIAYVMATRCDDEVASGLFTATRVDELVARVPAGAWRRLSCGDGAHGPRRYDWARLRIRREFPHGRHGWVLARRSISDPTKISYYVFGRRGTRLRELVRVAGSRWAVEESFQTAKNEVGLDQYQVRRYDAWYAHITLAMLAAAFRPDAPRPGHHPRGALPSRPYPRRSRADSRGRD
jgi:SRSO17 transposase